MYNQSKNQCIHKYRKIPVHHDNFVDNFILKSIEFLEPFILSVTNTPNYVTIFRIVAFLCVSILFYQSKTRTNAVVFIVGFFVNYYLDCLDGYLARRCKKMSQLGDFLDHFADFISSVIMLYFLYPLNVADTIIVTFLCFMAAIHMGNQQHYYSQRKQEKGESKMTESLDILMYISEKIKIPIEFTRFFGTGSSVLGVMLIFSKKYIM